MNLIKSFCASLISIVATLLFNEYFIYYLVLTKCKWPVEQSSSNNQFIGMMLIADTHLLGSRKGHWFDKLRREWQQHRGFQTARYFLEPDYIVIMGDLTDEGKWCSDWEWKYYENRVQELFYTNDSTNKTELIVVVGNHDVGFHYDMIDHKIKRFNRTFRNQYAQLKFPQKLNNINFLMLNSMALENDGCKFCIQAQRQLKNINSTLECLKFKSNETNTFSKKCQKKDEIKYRSYSQPILFTHFPLYRESDDICPEDIDSESYILKGIKAERFKENFDCLSKESTEQLIDQVNPRLIFNGHTHYSCYNSNHGVPEYTIASFSWRNIKQPSMLLLQVNGDEHYIKKCFLPSENTVYGVYTICLILNAGLWIYLVFISCFCRKRKVEKIN